MRGYDKMKTRIDINIDTDVALQFKSRVGEREKSSIINKLLRAYLESQGYETPNKVLLTKKKVELEQQMQVIYEEISLINVKLQALENETKAHFDEQRKKAEQLANSLKAADVLAEVPD